MSQRKKGAALSYVYIFITIAVGLLITPFTINHLGKREYGLYTLIGGIASSMQILEFGLNDTVVRFMSRFHAHDDIEGERNFLAIMNRIYGFISLAVLVVGTALLFLLPVIFPKIDPTLIGAAKIMLAVSVVNVAVTLFINPFTASIVAYERFVLLRSLDVATVVVSNAGVVLVLLAGQKSLAMVLVICTTSFIILTIKLCYALFVLKIRPKLTRFDPAQVKEIFAFSSAVFIVVIVEQIYWRLDGLILGAMISLEAVAVYNLGMSFSKYFMSFSTAISKVMMPRVVQRVEKGADAKELTDILITISRYQALVLLPVMVGLIVFGREFIHLWIKKQDFSAAYWVMLVTVIPYSVELIGNTRNQIMQAKNIYWHRSRVILVISLVNVVLTVILIAVMGMVGAAISTGIGIICGYVWINEVLKKELGLDIGRYRRELVSGLLPAMLLAAAVGWATYVIPGSNWGVLILRMAVFGLASVASIWYIGARPHERELVLGMVAKRRKAA